MYSYQLLPHTADIRLRIESNTLEGLFLAGLKGMAGIMADKHASAGGEIIMEKISLDSADKTALLIDFLSGALTLSNEKQTLFTDIKFINLTENSLKAEIIGLEVAEFKKDIKAVTYHEADIQKNKDGNWEATVIFDI